jgi:hypothetical protein
MAVTWTQYGAEAYDVLCDRVTQAKRDDPLAQVTILVPSHLCGVIVRRALARGVAGHSGIAGLTVLTVDRLAEQLAAPALVGAGRRPTIGPVLTAAWRRALEENAGVFASVAEHRATVRALVNAHRELRHVDAAGLEAMAAGEHIAADLVRLHCRVGELLAAGWYDVTDLRTTATATLSEDPSLASKLGTTVLFLPQELTPDAIAVLCTLKRVAALEVIAAHTGDNRADAAIRQVVEQVAPDHGPPPDRPIRTVNRIIHASDADDEVRCVVRDVVTRLRDTPSHRVAVLYGPAQPYARLLAEHLAAAGITTNGTGVRPTIERTLARTLLDLLELPDHNWRRDEVMRLLASAPVKGPDGTRVPASRWDRISRLAGVVAGDDWDARLAVFAEHERRSAKRERESDAPRSGQIRRRDDNADIADALRQFVAGLRGRLDAAATLTTWPELAAWAADTYRALVGTPDDEPWLPEDEARAADKVQRVLSGIAGLGEIESGADLTALRLTLELDLADDLPRQGTYGTGVLVAPLSAAIGLDADVVYVVGLAEGAVPARLREDALLPDRTRARTNGQLDPLRGRIDRQHRHLLAAFAAAPECVASFPRGDLRRSSHRLPSRWLLPSLRALSQTPDLNATGWEDVHGAWLDGSPSYAAGLSRTDSLATGQEWRSRAAVAARAADADIAEILGDDNVLHSALSVIRAHRSARLTRFDGDLAGQRVPSPTDADYVISSTSLENWASCPYAYFVGRLMRVEPIESPEKLIDISPIEIGNLVHYALDRFFEAQALAGAVPPPHQPWTAEQRADLERIAQEVADEFEARGLTGHPLLWRQHRARILTDLQRLLDDDDALRARTGREQVRSELTFGMEGTDPVEINLPDGRTLRLRGSADRVDRAGQAIFVVDYKSGGSWRFKDIGEDDPTGGGTKLQLPVYAHAARIALDAPDAEVSAEYWFTRGDERKQIGLPLTDHVHQAHTEALMVIADGIASGLFPHRPPADDGFAGFIPCSYCDPDGLGTADRRARWARKRTDPRLAAYVALVEPEEAES